MVVPEISLDVLLMILEQCDCTTLTCAGPLVCKPWNQLLTGSATPKIQEVMFKDEPSSTIHPASALGTTFRVHPILTAVVGETVATKMSEHDILRRHIARGGGCVIVFTDSEYSISTPVVKLSPFEINIKTRKANWHPWTNYANHKRNMKGELKQSSLSELHITSPATSKLNVIIKWDMDITSLHKYKDTHLLGRTDPIRIGRPHPRWKDKNQAITVGKFTEAVMARLSQLGLKGHFTFKVSTTIEFDDIFEEDVPTIVLTVEKGGWDWRNIHEAPFADPLKGCGPKDWETKGIYGKVRPKEAEFQCSFVFADGVGG